MNAHTNINHEPAPSRWAVPSAQRGARPAPRRMVAQAVMIAVWIFAAALCALSLLPHVSSMRSFVITGPSMTESIPLGSVVLVRPTATSDIAAGDVISFDQPGPAKVRITHRVVEVLTRDGKPVFRTKGDHNTAPDPWLVNYVDEQAWKVTHHVPSVGRLLLVTETHAARVALIILPVLVLMALALSSIWSPRQSPTHEG